MKRNNISGIKIAKSIGVCKQSVYDYASGRVQPPLDKAVKLVSYTKRHGKGFVRFQDLVVARGDRAKKNPEVVKPQGSAQPISDPPKASEQSSAQGGA